MSDSRILHELAGAVSLCWTPKPTGVFDSQAALAHVEAALGELRADTKAATALCDKHRPNGGRRAVCVICSGEKLTAALSRISYLCGPENEMDLGPYDTHYDETAVVRQVRAMRSLLQRAAQALQYHVDQTRPIDQTSDVITAIQELLGPEVP